ncbi:MAG: ABC-2 type transport system ATP-binding protein [Parcubacteria group bacterium Gr01-1014_66]|nr:MAG: ABC-2 type transport system ATP-binding protein [Parcubacteria group bacterium Gr01-1014_66]
MNILHVSHLSKSFLKLQAVDAVSFDLQEGEILGLLGPNGAGKTTLIQMLLGILTPTSGEIVYFGKSLARNRETILESIGFSSTYTNLPWDLTVRECLWFLSYLYKITDRTKRINRIVEIFSLGPLLKKPIYALSAGQLTRVNLAKALINFPRVLLLDEPTASLDPDAASSMRDFLLHQRNQFAISILITSHNMAEVEEVCDRVIFLHEGRIIADDTPEALARSIAIAHVSFLPEGDPEIFVTQCHTQGFVCVRDGRFVRVDIAEREIASFLHDLASRALHYSEISIEKPTLEDYFLQVARPGEKRAPTI